MKAVSKEEYDLITASSAGVYAGDGEIIIQGFEPENGASSVETDIHKRNFIMVPCGDKKLPPRQVFLKYGVEKKDSYDIANFKAQNVGSDMKIEITDENTGKLRKVSVLPVKSFAL